MPEPKPQAHIRIHDEAVAYQLNRIAKFNRRSTQAEGLIAIENHVAANRSTLRKGPKLKP